MTRNLWIKGTLRRDILNSNVVGSSSASTVVMLGVRVQNSSDRWSGIRSLRQA